MDPTPYDSSGTEDGLPNHDLIRSSRGGVLSEAMMITARTVSRETDLLDMNSRIHSLETEAYGAVLRAFIAQSDSLSWGKEALITDLRKELRVSDDQHRIILGLVNADYSIKAIRECRLDSSQKLTTHPAGFDSAAAVGHTSRKRLKTGHSTVLPSPNYQASAHPSPDVIPSTISVHVKDDQLGTISTLCSPQMNIGQAKNQAPQSRQAPSTIKVHFKDKLGSNSTLCSPQMNVGQAKNQAPQSRPAPSTIKERESLIVETSNMGFAHSGFENKMPRSDIIKMRATDKLLHAVENMCFRRNPDPDQVDRAKLILREQEGVLLELIGRLADVPACDDPSDEGSHSDEEPQWIAHEFQDDAYEKLDGTKGYYSESYVKEYANRAGIPCIDLADDE